METMIRLQGIGKRQAKKAGEIKVGDVLVWNYGETSTVLEIVKTTPKTIVYRGICNSSNYEYERRLLSTRLVAYKQ